VTEESEQLRIAGDWVALVNIDGPFLQTCVRAAASIGCAAELVSPVELLEQLQSRQPPLAVVVRSGVEPNALEPALPRLGVFSRVLVLDGPERSATEAALTAGRHVDVEVIPAELSESALAAKFNRALVVARELRRAQLDHQSAEDLERSVLQLRDKTIRLYEQRERMNAVTRLSHQINALDLDRILDVCIKEVPKVVGARLASVYLYDYDRGELVLKRHNHTRRINERIRLQDNPFSPMAHALSLNQVILIGNVESAEKQPNQLEMERPFQSKYGSSASMVVPLKSGDRIIGMLNLTEKIGGGQFDHTEDLPPLEQLSAIIGAAIRNCQLFQEVQRQARSDGMTGFLNHNSFYEELGREIRRHKRYGDSLSLVIMDVDDFKSFNDTYGHQAGDFILRETAKLVRENIRDVDIPARYGGDEFSIILPRVDMDGALLAASRIRKKLSEHPFDYQGVNFYITLSSGIGEHKADESSAEFVRKVDQALYRAKAKGKNRVEVAT
jgi:diguanylate cyclase (GGDEF)-like protein